MANFLKTFIGMFSFLGQREKLSLVFATCKLEVCASKRVKVENTPKNYGVVTYQTRGLERTTKTTHKICCFHEDKEYGPFHCAVKTKKEFVLVEFNGSEKVKGTIVHRAKAHGLYLDNGLEGIITHERTKWEKTTGIYSGHFRVISTTKTEYLNGKKHGVCIKDGVKRTRYLDGVLQ